MSLTLAIPTIRRFDLLHDCVWSALAGSVTPDRVLIIDNSGGGCPQIPGAEVVLGRQPQSVARAWNDAVRLAGSSLIIANDDVVFAPDTIQRLLEVSMQVERAGVVSAIEGERFALFWLNYLAWQDIGGFDEEFEPAYFEDNDAAWWLTVAGWSLPVAPSAVKHHASSTLRVYSPEERMRHHNQFNRNAAYYRAKCGGMPGQERYRVPFEEEL